MKNFLIFLIACNNTLPAAPTLKEQSAKGANIVSNLEIVTKITTDLNERIGCTVFSSKGDYTIKVIEENALLTEAGLVGEAARWRSPGMRGSQIYVFSESVYSDKFKDLDWRVTFLHELGHTLELEHIDDKANLMHKSQTPSYSPDYSEALNQLITMVYENGTMPECVD